MKMPLKASVALPWAKACLDLALSAKCEAQSNHDAAIEAKIVEIQEHGRWTLCAGRIPYTREVAEKIFDDGIPGYSLSSRSWYERGDRLDTWPALKGARSRHRAINALHERLTQAVDHKVILDTDEVELLSPFIT